MSDALIHHGDFLVNASGCAESYATKINHSATLSVVALINHIPLGFKNSFKMYLYLLVTLLSTSLYNTPITSTTTVTVTAPAPCFTPTGPEYYLKTHVVDGGNSSKDGLYLDGYHTGAGLNDAVLVPNTSEWNLAMGWLDGSYQVLTILTHFFVMWALIEGYLLAIRPRLLLPLEHVHGHQHQRRRF